jgi:hypothetical protein
LHWRIKTRSSSADRKDYAKKGIFKTEFERQLNNPRIVAGRDNPSKRAGVVVIDRALFPSMLPPDEITAFKSLVYEDKGLQP